MSGSSGERPAKLAERPGDTKTMIMTGTRPGSPATLPTNIIGHLRRRAG
jgi:hypothetical protein